MLNGEVGLVRAERLVFFTDAVAAIAITLLALELLVPTGVSSIDVLRFGSEHFDEYLAFLISLVVIGSHWMGHHHVFGYLNRVGGRLPRYNMLWLLLMVLTPFATRVITAQGAFFARFAFYAAVQALQSILFVLMVREMDRNALTRSGTPSDLFTGSYWRNGSIAVAFVVSIPLALFGRWAFLCWLAIPMLTLRVRRMYTPHRRNPTRAVR